MTTTTTMSAATIPASGNPNGAFCLVAEHHAAAAWPLAISAIAQATGQPVEAVATMLDGDFGGMFMRDVHDAVPDLGLAGAIDCVVQSFMKAPITPTLTAAWQVAPGTPYLTALVIAESRVPVSQ